MTTQTLKVAKAIRQQLHAEIKPYASAKAGTIGIGLSGGVDSNSILAECLDQGMRPVVVSYRPSTNEPTDYRYAKACAKAQGLKFVGVIVNMDPGKLDRDMRRVVEYGCRTKVEIESMIPMMHVFGLAAKRGVRVMLDGSPAGGYFCNSRTAMITYEARTAAPEVLQGYRTDYVTGDKGNLKMTRHIGRERGLKDVVFPYGDPSLLKAFASSTWEDINKPRQKEPIRVAYADYLDADGGIPVMKAYSNLHQGDTGFSDQLATALLSLEKYAGYRSAKGIYNAVLRGDV